MPLNVDLHSHSIVSDGVLTPTQVAERAHANGVQLWALTDHDELSGLAEAAEAARGLGMQFINGVEVSITWSGQTLHVVGLGVDPANEVLNEGLLGIRATRSVRAREMADKLERLGVANSYEGALPYAANPELVSRTHFARFLVDNGYCNTMQDAFDRYLADGKPAYVPMHWSRLDDALEWIHAAGGRAAIAHPGRYRYSDAQFDALYSQFKDLGGVGIEVTTGSHTPEQYQYYAKVARRYGFLASCGSDFHSPKESRIDLGRLPQLPPGLTPIWHDWV